MKAKTRIPRKEAIPQRVATEEALAKANNLIDTLPEFIKKFSDLEHDAWLVVSHLALLGKALVEGNLNDEVNVKDRDGEVIRFSDLDLATGELIETLASKLYPCCTELRVLFEDLERRVKDYQSPVEPPAVKR
jgi:hypothetical protein